MDSSSIQFQEFSLQSIRNLTLDLDQEFHFFVSPFRFPDIPSLIIELIIESTDINLIVNLTNLATSINNTFLSISNLSVQDTSENHVIPILSSRALPVNTFLPDKRNPSLSSYSLDLNNGIFSFTFDELVRVNSLNVTTLSLHDSMVSPQCNYTLSEGVVLSPNSNIVHFKLNITDFNEIKSLTCLATMQANTYISFGSTFIRDMNQNYINPILVSFALRSDSFTPDSTSPQLLSFSLNLNIGTLMLQFDETVNASSLLVSRLILSNTSFNIFEQQFVVLTGASFYVIDSTEIIIFLKSSHLDSLKLNRYFATHQNDTFLSIYTFSIWDMSSNYVTANTLLVDKLTPDTTSPKLTLWYPDMDRFTITLVFNEPIESDSIMANSISFQSELVFNTNTTDYFTLTGGSTSSPDGKMIIIDIKITDLNAIKGKPLLLSFINSSYITFTSFLCRDIWGNQVVEVSKNMSIVASIFIRDTVNPRLISWSLDMDRGIFNLTFSETMNISSVYFPGIGLQSTFNSSESYGIKLTGGSVLSQNHDILISIQLINDDLNHMKQLGIAR